MAITKIIRAELLDFPKDTTSSINTSGTIIPVGGTSDRPTPVTGEFRYNTDLEYVEFYDGSSWQQIVDEYISGQPTTCLCTFPFTNPVQIALFTSLGIEFNNFELNNNITDTCGNSTASWSGTPAYSTTAKFGSHSAEFSGGTGGTYIDSGVDPDASSDWTVSFWIYRTNTALYDLVLGSVDSSLNNGFLIGFYNQASNGEFDVYLRNASGNLWRTKGGTTNFNTWEHIALTYDNSGSGTTTIYHNGQLLTGITSGSNPATGSFASATNWYMGSAGAWNNERLTGYMDQTRFFQSTLTATQIAELYNEVACN